MMFAAEQPTWHPGLAVLSLRKARRHTQKQLAELVGWDASKISRIENGDQDPTYNELRALAKAQGAPLDYYYLGRWPGEAMGALLSVEHPFGTRELAHAS